MNTASIVNALKQECARINAAIAALTGGTAGDGRRRRGRRVLPGNTTVQRKSKRRLSAAARKRISEAAKARWAKAKRAGRSSL